MKRKGITIWEQHLERIVLGAALLFLVVFAALQIFGDPNSVDLPVDGKVSAGRIDDILEGTAQQLQARLERDAPPTVDIPDHAPMLDRFTALLEAGVSPEPQIAALDHPVVLRQDFAPPRDVTYAVPDAGPPFAVVAEQYFDAIASHEVEAIPELQKIVPEDPHDLTWVTAAARIDLAGIRDELRKSGPGDVQAIPVPWYLDRIMILDVRLEREELKDGTWGGLKQIDVLPGAVTFRPRLKDGIDKSTRDAILNELRADGVQQEIIRPPFYQTMNDTWSPPVPSTQVAVAEREKTPEEMEILALRQRLARSGADRERLLQRLQDLGGSMPTGPAEPEKPGDQDRRGSGEKPPREPGGSDRRAPGGARPPGSGPAGGGAPTGIGKGNEAGDRTGGTKSGDPAIQRLILKIRRLDGRIARDTAKLAGLTGGEAPADLAVADEGATRGDLAGDAVDLWAHDITIAPGGTYRYRFTIDLYNPFFGHKVDLLEPQSALAEPITIASRTSEWSSTVTAIRPLKVFVTRATVPSRGRAVAQGPGQLGMGQATAEVYRFYHGRWWMEQFPVQPGDLVGGEKRVAPRGAEAPEVEAVDFGTEWFVLDIIEDIDAEKSDREVGLGAKVLLQNLADGSAQILFDPREVAVDPERARLQDAVEEADAARELASSGM